MFSIYIYIANIHIIYQGPGDTCSLSLLSLIAMLSYRIVSSVPKIGIQRIVSYRHRTIMTFSVSYRIADLKWIYRIVSYRDRLIVLYRLRTRLSSLIVSCITEGKYTYINMHVAIYHVIGNYRLQAQTVSYRIVSYRPGGVIVSQRIASYRRSHLSESIVSSLIVHLSYRIVSADPGP